MLGVCAQCTGGASLSFPTARGSEEADSQVLPPCREWLREARNFLRSTRATLISLELQRSCELIMLHVRGMWQFGA